MKLYIYEGEALTLRELRQKYSGILPADPSEELLAEIGVEVVPDPDEIAPIPPTVSTEEGGKTAEEREAEMLTFYKENQLEALNREFLTYRQNATVATPWGFSVDAGERALLDVNGLVVLFEGSSDPVPFMDADNRLQMVTVDQLKDIQKMIIGNGARAYGVKWEIRDRILKAETSEEVFGVAFDFEPKA